MLADLVGKEGKITTSAVALAREAFFWEVMVQCTAKGYGRTTTEIRKLLEQSTGV